MQEYKWAAARQNKQNSCAPCENSDQHGHPPSLIRVFVCALWVTKDPMIVNVDSEDSDQTGRMARLIRVFAGCSGHFGWFCRMQAQLLRHLNAFLYCNLSLDHKGDKAVFTNNPEAFAADNILTLRKTCFVWFLFIQMWPGLKRSVVSSFSRPEFIDKWYTRQQNLHNNTRTKQTLGWACRSAQFHQSLIWRLGS